MKRLILAVGVLALFETSLFAADRIPGDLFGGYSFVTNTGTGARVTSHGWNASYAYNVGTFGLVGDFSGYYRLGVHTHIYAGGPQINFHQEKTDIFGRALFGGVQTTGSNGFVMGYGGGVDVKASEMFKLRVVQVDWMPVRMNGNWDNSPVRMSFGVVVSPGK
jgi:hypothetical protein